MDKRVILAVAGSGKTSTLIGRLDNEKRALLVTYTNNNVEHIKRSIIRKFGYYPSNVAVMSFFSFVYGFCLKPFLARSMGLRGISYDSPPRFATGEARFLNKQRQIYGSRISARLCQEDVIGDVIERIERYFDLLMIDEVQDLGGHDFNLLKAVVRVKAEQLLVGDFYQHTFDTSRDGNVNTNLYEDYSKYLSRLSAIGYTIDTHSLGASHRCSPEICELVSSRLGIEITSRKTECADVKVVENPKDALDLYENPKVVKLFYSESSKYGCYALNWGASKGQDHHEDVCVVMNKTTFKAFASGALTTLKPATRNKLYVALTRARRNVYIVAEANFRGLKQ